MGEFLLNPGFYNFCQTQVGPGDDYVLTVGGFNDPLSTLADAMTNHMNINGMPFTTK